MIPGKAANSRLAAWPHENEPSTGGTRTAVRLRAEAGTELREARVGRALSQQTVGGALGVSHMHVSRVERALVDVTITDLARHAAVLGLELSVRLYPAGPPIGDRAQLALLERFRARLSQAWSFAAEVPLPIAGDQRAWDALIRLDRLAIGVEAVTRLTDVQETARRLELKRRDGVVDHVVLLLNDTRHDREALRRYGHLLVEAFPVPARAALRALKEGRDPRGSSIVVL